MQHRTAAQDVTRRAYTQCPSVVPGYCPGRKGVRAAKHCDVARAAVAPGGSLPSTAAPRADKVSPSPAHSSPAGAGGPGHPGALAPSAAATATMSTTHDQQHAASWLLERALLASSNVPWSQHTAAVATAVTTGVLVQEPQHAVTDRPTAPPQAPASASPAPACPLKAVVHGSAAVRGSIKPDMQDRHILLPHIGTLAKRHWDNLHHPESDAATSLAAKIAAAATSSVDDHSHGGRATMGNCSCGSGQHGSNGYVPPRPLLAGHREPPSCCPGIRADSTALQVLASAAALQCGCAPQGPSSFRSNSSNGNGSSYNDSSSNGDDVLAVTASEVAPTVWHVPSSLAAVFDGHSGSRTSRFLAQRIGDMLARNRQLWAALECGTHGPKLEMAAVTQVVTALQGIFMQLDDEILSVDRFKPPGEFDGTTALVGLQVGQHMFVANLGDTRAVLSRNGRAVRLSRDHTPELEEERRRIESNGGYVRMFRGTWRLVLPLGPGAGLKICAVSRSFGDIDYKEPNAMMSAVPDVFHWPLQPGADRFVVYASDGVWVAMGDQQAVDFVQAALDRSRAKGLPPEQCAREAAAQLVAQAIELGSTDDITAVVSLLSWHDAPSTSPAPPA